MTHINGLIRTLQQALGAGIANPAPPQGGPMGDFWGLIEQAGPLRWPIFAVLVIGLILVSAKLYELWRDGRNSGELFNAEMPGASLEGITEIVGAQTESMIANLQSAMLNVFHTLHSEGMLHDEIANFVVSRQDQFGMFRRRMEFLSDTAGALGLMGTVWGMFVVFFQGTSDKDVILRGMGIALITTLLGLVVSIVLNFATTELSALFEKRLEQVASKSNQLRFRLLEIAAENGNGRRVDAPAPPFEKPSSSAGSVSPSPLRIEPISTSDVGAGASAAQIRLSAVRNGGSPVPGTPVTLRLSEAAGELDGGVTSATLTTDQDGAVDFRWAPPRTAGTYFADAFSPSVPGAPCRIRLNVVPAEPDSVRSEGNKQAAVAGMKLGKPLSITALDRYGNPVPDVAVAFRVTEGGGRLAAGGPECNVQTDRNGRAEVVFAVGSEAGRNLVEATVPGRPPVTFEAFGTEV